MTQQRPLGQELQDLDTQILQLGTLVQAALEKALTALETGDEAQAGTIIASDQYLDSLRVAIEEHAVRLLSWQQPLGDQTLRYLMSALTIASNLERVGDGAAGIAKMQLSMQKEAQHQRSQDPLNTSGYVAGSSIIQGILDLGHEALRVLHGTMQALAERDVRTARYIWQEDDVVDVRYHMVRHDLMNMMAGNQAINALKSDPDSLLRATYFLWIAHKLERVADHCTNICKCITFIIEGEKNITYPDD